MERHHGFRTRGLSRGIAAVPEGPVFEGRFGRMFRNLPVFHTDENELIELADSMSGGGRDLDNPTIPSGFTYLGQFVDHDITHDPNSSLQRMNDPEGLVNFRTPRYDLDSLYGRGPAETPFLYDRDSEGGVKLLVGKVRDDDGNVLMGDDEEDDLPRNEQGRAIIGDPRNDENTFVGQLHLVFIKFHNKVVDEVALDQGLRGDDLFKEAQRIVRWHYQWIVVHDFLTRIVPDAILDELLRKDRHGFNTVDLKFYRPVPRPFMPVEFSAAAYRFGHSQVRGGYRINNVVPPLPTFVRDDKLPSPEKKFERRRADFRGFTRLGLPPQWTIDWPFFFELDDEGPQPSLRINTKVAGPLADALPGSNHADETDRSLPRRNLLRGKALGLPSGQWVARAMDEGQLPGLQGRQTPLWYYILKEAEARQRGQKLGPVGGRIVAEVLLGLLASDPLSYLSVVPNWTPELPGEQDGDFTMADLIRYAVPAQAVRRPARQQAEGNAT